MEITTTCPIRIAIADNHAVFAKAVKACLDTDGRFNVVLSVLNTDDLFEMLPKIPVKYPDILLVEISMYRMSGIEVTVEIKKRFPQMKVVAFTLWDDIKTIKSFRAVGGDGYVIKASSPEELIVALEVVKDGFQYFPDLD